MIEDVVTFELEEVKGCDRFDGEDVMVFGGTRIFFLFFASPMLSGFVVMTSKLHSDAFDLKRGIVCALL